MTNYIDRLRKLRKGHGLTQQQVAEFLHLDRSTYAYYESGRTKISIDMLLRLADLFRVSISDLVGELMDDRSTARPVDKFLADGDYSLSALINDSVSRFSHLSREEQRLVILYRSGDDAQKVELMDAAEEITAPEKDEA